MIRLTVELDQVDFDMLIDRYLPMIGEQLRASGNPLGALLSGNASAAMAKGILRSLSQEKKERLAAELINGNRDQFMAALEKVAGELGVQTQVRSLQATQENG